MKTLGYLLVTVGMVLALGGIVAVFNFDQPSDMFSLAWWLIVGGWCLAFTGMGMDMMHVFKIAKSEHMDLVPCIFQGTFIQVNIIGNPAYIRLIKIHHHSNTHGDMLRQADECVKDKA